jgi:serine protease Do
MAMRKEVSNKAVLVGQVFLCLFTGVCLSLVFGSPSLAEAKSKSYEEHRPVSFSQLAKDASPSVVNIYTVRRVKGGQMLSPFGPNSPFNDFFERFFGDQMPREYKQQSLGTGFIIDKDGHILTNNHVVEQSEEIKVRFSDGGEFAAEIIGRDPKTDIALIKIETDADLIPLPLGDSESLEVGEWVLAIGNPFGLGNTVTAGIVSAKSRQIGAGAYDDFIQTDASINPGNSGGPLLSTEGKVVGINSAIFSQTGGSIGIGFAIPVNMAKDLLPQLKQGKVIRGWLGVMIQEVTPDLAKKLDLKDDHGALVADVVANGPAEKAGIERGDVITAFDGKRIKSSSELPYIVGSTPVGKTVTVEVLRKGKKKNISVKIEQLEEEGSPEKEAGKETPSLGLTVKELTTEIARYFGLSETSGLVIVEVERSSPGAEAGLQPGDIILEIEQESIQNVKEFNQVIRKYKGGDTILFLIKRRGSTLYLTLKVPD